jgi:hypothetical protein
MDWFDIGYSEGLNGVARGAPKGSMSIRDSWRLGNEAGALDRALIRDGKEPVGYEAAKKKAGY